MNSIAEQQMPILNQTLNMRHELLDALTDADLAHRIDGNPTLGELLKEAAEVEQQYADSFTTGTHNWSTRLDDDLATRIEALRAAFARSEQALKDNFGGLSETEVQSKMIDRIHMQIPASIQYHLFREAFLISMAKVAVYLKAMGKPLPTQLGQWIG